MSATIRLTWSVACSLLLACNSNVTTSSVDNTAGGSGLSSFAGASGAGATGSAAPPGASGSAGSGLSLNVDAGVEDGGSGGAGSGVHIIATLPAGFQATDMGGFQLGASLSAGGTGGASGSGGDAGALSGASGNGGAAGWPSGGASAGSANGNCGNVLVGVARDFRGANQAGGNPDFESPTFHGNDVTPNLVASMLGMDQKPVYASMCELASTSGATAACPYGAETTSKTNFDQWYRDTPGMNLPFVISLYLAPQPGGLFTFQSLHYFPLDGAGYGNSGVADDKLMHNFGFTTEIHTQFAYSGGETFQFQGDDDVWVFINGKLAVDLGGLHPRVLGKVSLDTSAATLGIQKGSVYNLDLFHAERHTDKSTFRIDTNLSFVNCGTVETIPK